MKQIIEETVKTTKLVPGGQAMAELADGRKVFIGVHYRRRPCGFS